MVQRRSKKPKVALSTEKDFYESLNLFKSLKPLLSDESYLNSTFASSRAYILFHEEEQYLADALAFLAQFRQGPHYVSASSLEERKEPVSLTVRIASNETPSDQIMEGLRTMWDIVESYARTGRLADQKSKR